MRIKSNITAGIVMMLGVLAMISCNNNENATPSDKDSTTNVDTNHVGKMSTDNKPEEIIDEYIVGFKKGFSNSVLAISGEQRMTAINTYVLKEYFSNVNASDFSLRFVTDYGFVVKTKSEKLINDIKQNGSTDTLFHNFTVPYTFGEAEKAPAAAGQIIPPNITFVRPKPASATKTLRAFVLDTGIDPNQNDLNILTGQCKSFLAEPYSDDFSGHGTHVSGIIAAKDNTTGVLGIIPNAPIVMYKIFNSGGFNFGAYLAALQEVKNNIQEGEVMNLSMNPTAQNSSMEQQLIKDIAAKKAFVVIAAGNNQANVDGFPTLYPAAINGKNIFTVGNHDLVGPTYAYHKDSNYGASIDCAAPGVSILSTLPGNNTGTMTGTSQSTPHVAGLLLLQGTFNSSRTISDGHGRNDIRVVHE